MRKNFPVNPWFYPLPVLIIGTYDENGNPDAMNAAWGGLYDSDLVEICLSAGHKTTKNIMKKKSLPKNYLLLDFFFNKKQKEILQRSYRKNKEETISKLLVNR